MAQIPGQSVGGLPRTYGLGRPAARRRQKRGGRARGGRACRGQGEGGEQSRRSGYLMATALAGEPIPPGAFMGALTRNDS